MKTSKEKRIIKAFSAGRITQRFLSRLNDKLLLEVCQTLRLPHEEHVSGFSFEHQRGPTTVQDYLKFAETLKQAVACGDVMLNEKIIRGFMGEGNFVSEKKAVPYSRARIEKEILQHAALYNKQKQGLLAKMTSSNS